MAGFSIMHLFAFSWKEYEISKFSADPLTAPGTGFSGDIPTYQGGRLGIKAFLDAANPWDIIKAAARGFRWLFIGRRKRFEDISYKNNGMNSQPTPLGGGLNPTSYAPPSFQGNGDGATELGSRIDTQRGRGETLVAEDDTQGLLSHAQSTSPDLRGQGAHFKNNMHGSADIGMGPPLHAVESPTPSAYGGFNDTSYHGAAPEQAIGVAYGGHDPAWDMWAGATRKEDQESVRPATYRTRDT